MYIGFIKISKSLIVMIIALLVIFLPMLLHQCSSSSVPRERISIPPVLLETATKVNDRTARSFSGSLSLVPMSESLTQFAHIFVPASPQLKNDIQWQNQSAKSHSTVVETVLLTNAQQAARAWLVLAGSFSQRQQANDVIGQLAKMKLAAFSLKDGKQFKVMIGPVSTKYQAESILGDIGSQLHLNGKIVRFNVKQFNLAFLQQQNKQADISQTQQRRE